MARGGDALGVAEGFAGGCCVEAILLVTYPTWWVVGKLVSGG